MQPALFLTWIEHQRSRAICDRLEIPLAELISKNRGIKRYVELARRTLATLRKQRPRVLIVQTPSQVLGLLTLILRPFIGYRLVLDAHNEAVEPYLHPSAAVGLLTRYLLRKADRVIVSNRQLAEIVAGHGGTPLILSDALPRPHAVAPAREGPHFRVVVISTYAGDEPLAEIVAAAAKFDDDVRVFVTGNAAKCPDDIRDRLPGNVTLTGFLSEADYWQLLASSNAIVDLTTMDHCLVCGAYEGISLGKPLLLSDNAASVTLFADFAEFVPNDAASIAAGLRRLRERIPELTRDAAMNRERFQARWQVEADQLRGFIANAAEQDEAIVAR